MIRLSSFLYFVVLFLQGIPCYRAFLAKAPPSHLPDPPSTRGLSSSVADAKADDAQLTSEYNNLTERFCDLLRESLRTQTFTSFSLQGPKAAAARTTTTTPKEVLRGRLKRVQGRIVQLKKKKNKKLSRCVQVTFKFHGATDIAKNYEEDEIADTVVRPLLEGQSVVDSEWGPAVQASIGTTVHTSLQGARLETFTKQVEYHATNGKKPRLVERNVKAAAQASAQTSSSLSSSPLLAHDRVKQRPLSPTNAVLPALGLTDAKGRPKPGKKAKLAQVQKFVEIVSRLIQQQQQQQQHQKDDPKSAHSNGDKRIRIYDLGCGRGYLTFCLHAHLMQNEDNQGGAGGPTVETFGIDVRPKLVKDMNQVSQQLNFHDGLSFVEGTIEQYMLADKDVADKNNGSDNSLKVWLALHACDTATDDALWSGIVQQASIIVVAPCCHKELRPQLDRSQPVPDVLRHGIFRQRWAATLTDSIRVMLLEMAGYQVQVMEFVQTADTPQNVMITAVKKPGALDPATVDKVRQRLVALAQSYGVEKQALATWMGETLNPSEIGTRSPGAVHSQMPPL